MKKYTVAMNAHFVNKDGVPVLIFGGGDTVEANTPYTAVLIASVDFNSQVEELADKLKADGISWDNIEVDVAFVKERKK